MKWKLFFLLLIAQFCYGQTLNSPHFQLQLLFELDSAGRPIYQLSYKGNPVIDRSKLGFWISGNMDFSNGFTLIHTSNADVDKSWEPVMGEEKSIRNQYREMLVELQSKRGWKMNIRFRLYDDGLGFRYEFPIQEGLRHFRIDKEFTEFVLRDNAKAFWLPSDYDTNEFPTTISKISQIAHKIEEVRREPLAAKAPSKDLAVQTPLMLKTSQGLYVNIHEAALINFPAMHLKVDDERFSFEADLAPNKNGELAFLQTQQHSPWRTIIVSDDARDILKSKLILNLNEPSVIKDTSWIKPMKYIGVWWEYFTGEGSTWAYSNQQDVIIGTTDYRTLRPNHHHGANTAHVKKYIDFAAEHGFDGVLVEGWNEGWEDNWAYGKDEIYSFTKAYPDFDIAEISEYAKKKKVKMIMHHETTSSVINYERNLNDAFSLMNKYDYPLVKTGYVGPIIPRSEYHDSQWMVNHYAYVAQKAADYKIMVNSHEAARPTGLHRTFPNWIAQESARGTEFESFNGNPPNHTTILPFTRLVGGPMDYTPGIFRGDLSVYGKNKAKLSTTLVKQLALYVVMYSPLQMAADLPENYMKYADAFQFIKDVALDWDHSYILEAEPGEYITIARKTKNKPEWFVGSITNEKSRNAIIDFSFLPKGKVYQAEIYQDGEKADYTQSVIDYKIYKRRIKATSKISFPLKPSGGLAIKIVEEAR